MNPGPETITKGVTLGRRSLLAASMATAAVAATACGFDNGGGNGGNGGDGGNGGNEGGKSGTLKQSMMPVAFLDPHRSGNSSFGQIIQIGLWEGLVVIDVDDPSQVVGGVAESWDVSDDGLTYTFHLRDNAKWSNGDPVTAEDFEWNFKRALTPGIGGEGTPSFPITSLTVVGGLEYREGATDDFSTVGAKAVDEKTFEVTLEQPNPDALIEFAQYSCLPLHPASTEEKGDAWLDPDGWVSNGPYILDSFRVNQGATLLPNEEYWDTDSYHIARWEITFNDGGTTADLLAYQQGDLHITGRIEDDLEAVTTSDVADELVTSPTNQIRQLNVMASENPFLYDIRVREALAISIDRETLGDIGKPAIAGPSLVPNAIVDYEKVFQIPYDVDRAKSLLAEAGFPDGKGAPTVYLLDYMNAPWTEALAKGWRDNLGLDVRYDVTEIGVYSDKRTQVHGDDYCGFFMNNVAVSPPTMYKFVLGKVPAAPNYYGSMLLPPDVAKEMKEAVDNQASVEDRLKIAEGHYDKEFEEARDAGAAALAIEDDAERQAALIEAASMFNQYYTIIPALWGGYNLLVKPVVKNLKPWMYSSVMTTKNVTVEE